MATTITPLVGSGSGSVVMLKAIVSEAAVKGFLTNQHIWSLTAIHCRNQ
jgi:hypothetical protein